MTKAACLERDKRSTAGKRMSTLIGQAVEDDDVFWNHSTWEDKKGGDGEESDVSFRESDEDEEDRKDTFDSDFNDSESDDDGGEGGNVNGEDEHLRLEEKREHGTKRKAAYKEPSIGKNMVSAMSAGRELMQKRKSASARKKAMKGEGMNAGIVLNFPGVAPPRRGIANKAHSNFIPKLPAQQVSRIKSANVEKTKGLKRSLRASTITTSIQANAARRAAVAVSSTTSNKVKTVKEFTQEELIMEALQDTEAENERWILSRKRIMDEEEQAEQKKKLLRQNTSNGRVICKTYSRKGCYNTITFPDMDFVPKIFTGSDVSKNDETTGQRSKANFCVITGKVARYRDPKTMKAYYNLAAFRVLRKRFEAGERLEGPVKYKESAFPDLLTSTDESEKSDTVPLPDLLDSLGCSPTNHLLDDCNPSSILQSSSENRGLTEPIKTVPPKADPFKNATTISYQTSSEVPSTTTLEKDITPDKHTSTTGNVSESRKRDVTPSKLKMVSMMDSQTKAKMDLRLNSTKLLEIKKLDKYGEECKGINFFTPIAELKASRGENAKVGTLPPSPCLTLKAGHENCGGEAAAPKDNPRETIVSGLKPENKVEAISVSGGKIIMPTAPSSSTSMPVAAPKDNPRETIMSGYMKPKNKVEAISVSGGKIIMPTAPSSSTSMPVALKEENYRQRIFEAEVVAASAIKSAIPVANEQGIGASKIRAVMPNEFLAPNITSSDLSHNTRLNPMKAIATNNTVKPKTVKKKSNPTKYPVYNTAAKKSPPVRKKRKPRKSSNTENSVSVATSENLANLHAQLASHISPLGPSFYPPISSFSNQQLHHLLSKTNQIPYGYSNPIQPPPLDMASLYALGLTSPLQSIPATFPLSLQHQHLLHQRRNHVPTMNFSQPSSSHLPPTSASIMGNLMRAYNIVSAAADAQQRTTQQQQNYDASKTEENGNR